MHAKYIFDRYEDVKVNVADGSGILKVIENREEGLNQSIANICQRWIEDKHHPK